MAIFIFTIDEFEYFSMSGDKICKMLDEKLEKHITQYGEYDIHTVNNLINRCVRNNYAKTQT